MGCCFSSCTLGPSGRNEHPDRGHRGEAKSILKKKNMFKHRIIGIFYVILENLLRGSARTGEGEMTVLPYHSPHVPTEIGQGKGSVSQPQPAFHQHYYPCTTRES